MIIDQCPHCSVRHVQASPAFHQPLKDGDGTTFWAVVRCQNSSCKRLVLVETDARSQVSRMFPFAAYELTPAAQIPDAVREDFREAGLCLGANCYKASLVMSRRVLQRCLADQGCNQNKLVDAINAALADGTLRKAFKPLAEEVRQYGNLGAHPDDDNLAATNQATARQVLEFARLLIHEFYELPATAAALKQGRQ